MWDKGETAEMIWAEVEDGDRLDRDNAAASSGKGVNARCKAAFVQKNYSQTHSQK